jgi:hypothetical protein
LRLHGKQESTIADLRTKIKHLRQDNLSKEKQLGLAHRTIERLAVDKRGLEAGEAARKAYIRQLESRLAMVKTPSELKKLCVQQEKEIASLQEELQTANQAMAAAHEEAQAHRTQVLLLQRSVHIAAEQLSKSAGTDMSSELLLTTAQYQEEKNRVSQELQEAHKKLEEMSAALHAARSHLESQHEALLQWQQWEQATSTQTRKLEDALKAEKGTTSSLKMQLSGMQTKVAEMQQAKSRAEHALELERTAREEAEATIEKERSIGICMAEELQALRCVQKQKSVKPLDPGPESPSSPRKSHNNQTIRGSLDVRVDGQPSNMTSSTSNENDHKSVLDTTHHVSKPFADLSNVPHPTRWVINPLATESPEKQEMDENKEQFDRCESSILEDEAWRILERQLDEQAKRELQKNEDATLPSTTANEPSVYSPAKAQINIENEAPLSPALGNFDGRESAEWLTLLSPSKRNKGQVAPQVAQSFYRMSLAKDDSGSGKPPIIAKRPTLFELAEMEIKL